MKHFLKITKFMVLGKKELLFLILLAISLSGINNYFFYSHVERHGYKMANRLESIIEGEVEFSRQTRNDISGISYRENIATIVKNFSKERFYNASLILTHEKKGLLWKAPKKRESDGVVASYIKINIPELKSNHEVNFEKTVVFDKFLLGVSILRSMTYSIFPDPIHWWNNLDREWDQIFWWRSRPAIFFFLIAYALSLIFKYRETKIAKMEQEIEQERKNKKILETTFGITEQDDEMKLYQAIINNDMDKLRAINSISPTMNILKFNAIVDHTEEEKLKLLEILIDKRVDLTFKDDEGMTALMYYALGNKDNHKDSKIIETLIKNGLDINAQNNSGMTALMLCAVKNRPASVQILIDNGADKNTKQDLTAKELAATKEIRDILNAAENHNPQQLVKLLSNFTHAPMKFTTHTWDFGKLSNVFGTFDEAMDAVKEEFKSIEPELKDLSQSLHMKIKTFLFNDDSELDYSWCSKASINIGWLNIQGKSGETLQEYCDNGNNAFDFKLKTSLIVNNNEVSTFGDVINLFKQEIEFRTDFKNLEPIFTAHRRKLKGLFKVDLSDANLKRQFYSDTQQLSNAIEIIFSEIKKRKDYPRIEVKSRDLDDKSIEIIIIQVDSKASKSSQELLKEIEDGDFADIRKLLLNLCDWSVEATCEDGDFRVNYLHSNNEKDIKPLSKTVLGFTHILRFYR